MQSGHLVIHKQPVLLEGKETLPPILMKQQAVRGMLVFHRTTFHQAYF